MIRSHAGWTRGRARRRSRTPLLVATSWSLHLPGAQVVAALQRHLATVSGAWTTEDIASPDRAGTLLGCPGLLYAEPATRLALCAVHRAFRLPPGARPDWPRSTRTAVVVTSNLGQVATVAEVVRAAVGGGGGGLDAPDQYGNAIARSVGRWFGFAGPNLMVCSGPDAGLDGLALGGLLLRSGRASRVVLVGVEPADPVATALHGAPADAPPLCGGAACVVLRTWPYSAEARGDGRRSAGDQVVIEAQAEGRWLSPPQVTVGAEGFDPMRHWGDSYGAQGVVNLALAAHLAADEGQRVVAVRADRPDRTIVVGAIAAAGRLW